MAKSRDEQLDEIDELLDVSRTNKLFDSSIDSSEIMKKRAYTPQSMKEASLVLGFGNLHVNTSKVKLGAIRLKGYINGLRATKKAIERQVRNSRKYPR